MFIFGLYVHPFWPCLFAFLAGVLLIMILAVLMPAPEGAKEGIPMPEVKVIEEEE